MIEENIELIKNGVRIGTETYKIGDKIRVVDSTGEVQINGTVTFKKYMDGEGYYDLYHLGFLVESDEIRMTLPDVLDMRRRGWRIIKED